MSMPCNLHWILSMLIGFSNDALSFLIDFGSAFFLLVDIITFYSVHLPNTEKVDRKPKIKDLKKNSGNPLVFDCRPYSEEVDHEKGFSKSFF